MIKATDVELMIDEQIVSRGVRDPRVLDAIRRIPRHLFVPKGAQKEAYRDSPLPIGCKQTISQPYIVAAMTEALGAGTAHRVLEIGTGSGYQAAVLSLLALHVDTIETVDILYRRAKRLLLSLEYQNISCHFGDGYNAIPDCGVYDRIIVTAAAPVIPQSLVAILAEAGRMVVPVGKPNGIQDLVLAVKERGKLATRSLMPVRFVPMTGLVQRRES